MFVFDFSARILTFLASAVFHLVRRKLSHRLHAARVTSKGLIRDASLWQRLFSAFVLLKWAIQTSSQAQGDLEASTRDGCDDLANGDFS